MATIQTSGRDVNGSHTTEGDLHAATPGYSRRGRPASLPHPRDSFTVWITLLIAALFGAGVLVAVLAPHRPVETHVLYRTPAMCTKAALLAAQNELDWQTTFQAHVDVENEALDGATFHEYRRDLVKAGGPPAPVNLGACR